jgi:hypothetical protein
LAIWVDKIQRLLVALFLESDNIQRERPPISRDITTDAEVGNL